jgi:hypothetical protein
MERIGTSAAVVLALLAAAGCGDRKLDVKTPGLDEFSEFMARDTMPVPEMTRAEALEKHRECMRNLHGPDQSPTPELRGMKNDPATACAYWLRKATPEPRHVRRRSPDSMFVDLPPTRTMTREELDKSLLEDLRIGGPPPSRAPAPRE